MSILPGNGDGTFASPTNFDTQGSTNMVVADLNSDAFRDTLTTAYNKLEIYASPRQR